MATNFIENDFGVEGYSSSDDIYDMIPSGGSPAADAEDVLPIEEEEVPKKASASPKAKIKEPSEEENEEEEIEEVELDPFEDEEDTTPAKTTSKKAPVEEEEEDEEETNMYAAYAEDFKSMNLFTPLEDGQEEPDIKTPEGLQERLGMEVSNRARAYLWNNILGTQGEEGQRMFNAIFVNKVPIESYLQAFNKAESVRNLEIEDDDEAQEKVIKAYYTAKNKNSEFIEKKLQKLRDLGEVEEMAKEYQEELLLIEEEHLQKMEEQAQLREEQRQQSDIQYRTNITNILNEGLKNKELGGIPISPKKAQDIYTELTQPKWKLPDGSLLTEFDKTILDLRDPNNHELKTKMWLLLKQLQEDPSLSAIKKKGVSEEVKSNKLFQQAQRNKKQKKSMGIPSGNFVDI